MEAVLPSRARQHKPGLGAGWAFVALSGAIWGIGGAATLARTFHWAFGYSVGGTAFCAVVGAVFTVALAKTAPLFDSVQIMALDFLPFWLPLIDVVAPDTVPWRGGVLWGGAVLVWVLIRLDRCQSMTAGARCRRGWFLLAVGLPLIAYLFDLSAYVGRADTFEFQVIGPQLGIAHPSGYPLYTLICKLFSLLPVGTIAWRINLSSAVFAALASGFVYLALSEGRPPCVAGWRVLALLSAWVLAFSPTLWSRAIEAEVYALNACLVAAGLWLAVRWHTGRTRWVASGNSERIWPAFGLLIGLALASHITLGALVFVAACGLLVPALRPSRRAWLGALGLGVLGVALYIYIPLRWPAVTDGQLMSPAQFLRFITNADSGGALRALAFYHDPARWSLVGRLLLAQIGWGGVALAGLGLIALAWTLPTLALGSGLAFMAWIWFALSFYVAEPDYSAFLIPAYVVLVFWLGVGVNTALRGFSSHVREKSTAPSETQEARQWMAVGVQPSLISAAIVLVALLPLSRVWLTGPGLDARAQGRDDEAWARYVLNLPLAEGAAILADSEKFPPLYYLQQITGLRPDLDLVTLFDESQYRQALEARLGAGQRVYLARFLPGMDAYGVSALGPLVEVAPPTLRRSATTSGVGFGDTLALAGHALSQDSEGRALHHLILEWVVRAPVAQDLDVRLRLVGEEGVVWESAARRPVAGYTTTRAWQVGWTVSDYHALVWPAWLPPGRYELEVGLFPHFEQEGLPVGSGDAQWHRLDEIRLSRQDGEILPNRHAVLLSGEDDVALWLVGSRIPGEVSAGARLDVDLAWICRDVSGQAPHLAWVDVQTGTRVEVGASVVGEPEAPCGHTSPARSIRRYTLMAPDAPGQYRLEIGALGNVQCGWLAPGGQGCPLADVTVALAGAGLANYGGKLLLLEAEMDADGVLAGGPLNVDLRWRALEAMVLDYTVFVQAIGSDGQVYGQIDSWPGQGARPTSGWRPGEEVADPYSFYLRNGAPPGEYRVIVGLYLLADMSRLPVVDGSGNELGDFTQIGAFTLP